MPNITTPVRPGDRERKRNVDCSGKNLTALPHGLQDNVIHLNLSYNYLANHDHQLTRFSHLRSLDLSNNLLRSLPSHLPRSLWEVYASSNKIKVLHKLDTAYQWNLKILDVSRNELQRIVLINNTLSSLQILNLSWNQLWTVPTNMPHNIQTIDLSNNFLTRIIPGTFVRMPKLQKLFLHNNKFVYIPNNAFQQLLHLKEITLFNNPWTCNEIQNMIYLLEWIKETSTNIIGFPCPNETSQHGAVVQPSAPSRFDIVFTTTSLFFQEAQETKYKQVPLSKPRTTDTLTESSELLESADYFQFTDEGSAHEYFNLDFNTFITKDIPQTNVLENEEFESYESTVTLSYKKAKPDNAFFLSSTVVTEGLQAAVTKLTDIKSAANKEKGIVNPCLLLLLIYETI
ncbi:hypothetical protein GDO86_003953 [Hymenochirus boettgeri]|uniref:Oligodendrocyte-myelin glycoprotein n=1 Tax=Hymenochirus boettgeri TaxID=247094 RepID=A0A8T2K9A2_9PIPI|nr:hypothetical protein GDO86_003953 [Hymenochirus boettgeri]